MFVFDVVLMMIIILGSSSLSSITDIVSLNESVASAINGIENGLELELV